MKQISFADTGFERTNKRTRKRVFLEEMEQVVPWSALVARIDRHIQRAATGRPPFATETMLRIHFLQQWFGLSDPAMEEALHDVPLYRRVAGREPDLRGLRPHLAVRGVLRALPRRGVLADEVGVMTHTVTVRCVAILPRPERPAWPHRPS